MPVSLLDVNVLVALLSADSLFHDAAQKWFLANAYNGWATCPMTQAGFVRIICNPAVSRNRIHPSQAIEVLEANLGHPSHKFWPDDLSAAKATAPFQRHLAGHQQITDAYLLGLALKHRGQLVTFDKAVQALATAAEMDHLVFTIRK